MVVFFNGACSKCRAAVAILDRQQIPHDLVEDLEAPPDRVALTALVGQLVDPVDPLVRTQDPAFTDLGLDPAA